MKLGMDNYWSPNGKPADLNLGGARSSAIRIHFWLSLRQGRCLCFKVVQWEQLISCFVDVVRKLTSYLSCTLILQWNWSLNKKRIQDRRKVLTTFPTSSLGVKRIFLTVYWSKLDRDKLIMSATWLIDLKCIAKAGRSRHWYIWVLRSPG